MTASWPSTTKAALDGVLPELSKGGWVKGTVEITATFPTLEDAVLTVAGKPFNMEMLEALDQVEITVEGTTYTGIRILDLLDAAGVAGDGSLRLVASDGYEGQVGIDVLTDESILAYNDEGGVSTVLPETDKGAWVKYVVEITVIEPQVSTERCPRAGRQWLARRWWSIPSVRK